MRIGELARRGECDVETIRFYEREGLIDTPARETNGYRRYAEAHLAQLNIIRHCRSLDIGLPEVRLLRRFQANPELACDEVNRLVDRKIARLHQQIESLRQLERQLHALRRSCDSGSDADPSHTAADCGILRNLERAALSEGCPCHRVNGEGAAARQPDYMPT